MKIGVFSNLDANIIGTGFIVSHKIKHPEYWIAYNKHKWFPLGNVHNLGFKKYIL